MIDLIQVTTRSILLLSFDSGYISITESISAIIKMENKIKSFNGQGNLTEFVTKVELHSALKGFTGEKKAQNLASRLEGPAFDVYLRLSAEERKDFDQIKGELLKEFEKGQLNREEAIFELSNRNRLQGESALTYSYKIMELIKLAYPGFDDSARAILAKDYFVRGLHPDMRSALKAMEKFQSCDVKALAAETVRLELAGVKSNMTIAKCHSANAISIDSGDEQIHPTVIDKIADKVVEKLNAMTTDDQSGGNNSSASGVNYTSNQPFHRGRGPLLVAVFKTVIGVRAVVHDSLETFVVSTPPHNRTNAGHAKALIILLQVVQLDFVRPAANKAMTAGTHPAQTISD